MLNSDEGSSDEESDQEFVIVTRITEDAWPDESLSAADMEMEGDGEELVGLGPPTEPQEAPSGENSREMTDKVDQQDLPGEDSPEGAILDNQGEISSDIGSFHGFRSEEMSTPTLHQSTINPGSESSTLEGDGEVPEKEYSHELSEAENTSCQSTEQEPETLEGSLGELAREPSEDQIRELEFSMDHFGPAIASHESEVSKSELVFPPTRSENLLQPQTSTAIRDMPDVQEKLGERRTRRNRGVPRTKLDL